MCSMSLTLEETCRSNVVTTRLAISSVERPPYWKMTLRMGRSMAGKMSTGIVLAAIPPIRVMSRDMITNV